MSLRSLWFSSRSIMTRSTDSSVLSSPMPLRACDVFCIEVSTCWLSSLLTRVSMCCSRAYFFLASAASLPLIFLLCTSKGLTRSVCVFPVLCMMRIRRTISPVSRLRVSSLADISSSVLLRPIFAARVVSRCTFPKRICIVVSQPSAKLFKHCSGIPRCMHRQLRVYIRRLTCL